MIILPTSFIIPLVISKSHLFRRNRGGTRAAQVAGAAGDASWARTDRRCVPRKAPASIFVRERIASARAMARKRAFARRAGVYLESLVGAASKITLETYNWELKLLEAQASKLGLPSDPWTWGDREALALRELWIGEYAPTRVHRLSSVLNGLLLAGENGTVASLRARRRWKLPLHRRGTVRWPKREEQAVLLSAAQGTERIALVLAFEMGLRRAEITRLRLSDIRAGQVLVRGKGAKNRALPLTERVRSELEAYLTGNRKPMVEAARRAGYQGPEPDAVLLYRRGAALRGYTPDGLGAVCNQVGKRVGIPFSPHDGRRAFGMRSREQGVDPFDLKALMGHANLETTLGYTRDSPEALRRAMERIQTESCTPEPEASKT